MNLWERLVTKNPMSIEVVRFRRKYFTFNRANQQSSAMLGLVLVIYAALLMIVGNLKGEMPPVVLTFLLLTLLTFGVPGLMHSAIAGERERRSWELLQVAPVTKAQIVAGKFIAALASIGAMTALTLIPMLYAAVTYRRTDFYGLFMGLLVALAFAIFLAALTLFLSARVKRPFIALGSVLGTLLMMLIVLPAVLYTANDPLLNRLIELMHPFIIIGSLADRSGFRNPQDPGLPIALLGPPTIAAYLFLAVAFLIWTERTLTFADNDVRFLPKKKNQ